MPVWGGCQCQAAEQQHPRDQKCLLFVVQMCWCLFSKRQKLLLDGPLQRMDGRNGQTGATGGRPSTDRPPRRTNACDVSPSMVKNNHEMLQQRCGSSELHRTRLGIHCNSGGGGVQACFPTPPPLLGSRGSAHQGPHAHSKHHKCTAPPPPPGKVLHLPVETTYPLVGGGGYPFPMHFYHVFKGFLMVVGGF